MIKPKFDLGDRVLVDGRLPGQVRTVYPFDPTHVDVVFDVDGSVERMVSVSRLARTVAA